MQHRHDLEARAVALDACLDRMVSGDDWQEMLPSDSEEQREALSLVAVARRLVETASLAQSPGAELKQRVWERVAVATAPRPKLGIVTRLTGISVLYRRPEQPSLVHRILFARIPCLPPLVLDYREAS